MGNLTIKEALLKTMRVTKDYVDDKITLATKELKQSNYNLLSNGKFKNCYVDTYDMIPSWECDSYLQVYDVPSNSSTGWIKLYNRTSELGLTKSIQQRVDLEDGETYTLTFKAGWQENVNGGVICYIGYYDSSDSRLYTINVPIINQIDNADELQTFTFTTPTNLNYEYIVFKFHIGDTVNSGGSYIYAAIGDVKLEKGNSYTGWRGSKKDEDIIIEGPNLIQNGDFSSYTIPKTIDGWQINGDGVIGIQTEQEGYSEQGCICFINDSTEDVYSGFFQRVYNLKKRTEYTLTFYIGWEENVRDFYADLVFVDHNDTSLFTIDLKPSYSGIWSYTFVTPDIYFSHMNVGFCHRGIKEDTGGSFLGIAGNVKLTENVAVEDLGTVLSKYTTKTEFQQTNEDFAFRIAQAGGGNLIKNSLFKSDTKYWYNLSFGNNMVSNEMWVWEPWSEWNNNKYNALTYFADINNYGGEISAGFDTEWIPVQPYTAYSFSCYLACHRSKEVAIEVWYDNGGTNTYLTGESLTSVGTGRSWGQNYDNWTRYETTFTVPSTKRIWLRIYMTNHDENSDMPNAYLWLSQPVLVEGYTPSKVWIPHESELYDGIVKIDDRGLSVQHDNNKSVVLDSEALKFYEDGELYSKIDGGLFKIMKPGDSSTTIGSMGRFRWVNSGTCCTCVSAGPGHDVAIGSVRTSGEAATCSLVDSSQGGYLNATDFYYDQGLTINRATCYILQFKGSKSASFDSQAETSVGALSLWSTVTSSNSESNSAQTGCIYSRDTLQFGIAYGQLKCAMEICETPNASNNTAIHMYSPLNMHRYTISNANVTSSVSASSEYTSRLLSEGSIENINYGTLSYYEGEIRWCWKETVFTYAEADVDPVTDEWVYTGRNICYIELPIFMAESIQNDYHINICKMSWGDYRIVEKNPYYFIIESQEEDFAFTFEVVAKLLDSETLANNVSISSMSTTANPSVSVEPPTSEDIILPGSENIWQSAVVEEEVMDDMQENINIGEE